MGLIRIDLDILNLTITLAQIKRVGDRRMVIAISSYSRDLVKLSFSITIRLGGTTRFHTNRDLIQRKANIEINWINLFL